MIHARCCCRSCASGFGPPSLPRRRRPSVWQTLAFQESAALRCSVVLCPLVSDWQKDGDERRRAMAGAGRRMAGANSSCAPWRS